MENNQNAFILFKTEDEKISVDVRFEEETVWLTQEQMALLFLLVTLTTFCGK